MTSGKLIGGALAVLVALTHTSGLAANEVKVEGAQVQEGVPNTFHFSVTLRHADNGWDHYADRWQVVSPDGFVLGTRVLMHPHDSEQPFTRGMSGIVIPDDLTWVHIRGHDKVHGNGPVLLRVDLPGR